MSKNLHDQLSVSLKLFLFVEAYAPRDISEEIPLSEINRNAEEKLQRPLIIEALKMWQAHQGDLINEEEALNKSITEIVTEALSSPQIVGDDYRKMAYQKVEEACEELNQYLEESNKEYGIQERDEYLMNLN